MTTAAPTTRTSRSQRRFAALTLLWAILWASSGPLSAQQKVDPAGFVGGEMLVKGDFSKALAELTAGLAASNLSASQRAGLLNDRGLAHWRLGDLGAALDDFNKAAAAFPELAAIYNNRGNVLLALQTPTEALRDFDRAVLLAPAYAAAYNNRAIAEVQLQRSEAAIADFTKAAELSPNSPAPVNGRGKVHLENGRPYLALRDFSRAIAIEPSYRPAYRNGGLARIALHQQADAIDSLTNALTFAPNDTGLLLTRGLAEADLQAYPAALADFDKLVAAAPKSAQSFAERGHVKALLGMFAEAFDDLGKAIELDPKYRDAYLYRAQAHLANKEPDLGLADAERALKIDQHFGRAYKVRAGIEEALGQKQLAAADFDQAAGYDPGDDEVWTAIKRLSGRARPAFEAVPGPLVSGWKIVKSAGQLKAANDKVPEFTIPLEAAGPTGAELTGWEEKGGIYKGIGVLRYASGHQAGGPVQPLTEYAAVIDMVHHRVLGIEPYKIGDQDSVWDWADTGDLTVKGPDGLTSTLRLAEALAAQQKPAGVAARAFSAGSPQSAANVPARSAAATAPAPRPKKTFTLFDLLFN